MEVGLEDEFVWDDATVLPESASYGVLVVFCLRR